ncbi:hypothetical protein [Pseudoalteromonas viridis]|uniref:Uncharacterized protein n=1 Tax=Pseudoalteromonas viridis TaxID=339617 RepID=A0ABX7V3P6_9GAMM|nr:hypothetical protein [Pseudoalteromonas viridis]QTL35498.1 hypothetical protein J5X90_18625 [Pseudoalteromonas viridis]
MFLLPLAPLISGSARVASDIVTDTEPPSYHALAAISGNDKVDLNCLPAPGMATSLCQSAQLPLALPKAQCLSPDTTTPLAEQQASRYRCPDGPQDVASAPG